MNKDILVYKDLRKFRTNQDPKTWLEIESSGQGYAESRGLWVNVWSTTPIFQ